MTTEVIFFLERLIEKFREKNKDLHIVFLDLEEAYDSAPRWIIWWVLEKKGVSSRNIGLVKEVYDGTIMSVGTTRGRRG